MAVDQWESLCCHHLSGIVYNNIPVSHWDSSPCFMAPCWRSEKNLSSTRLPLCFVNQPTSLEFSCLLCCIVFINELAWGWWCCTVIWFDMQAHDNNNKSHHSFLNFLTNFCSGWNNKWLCEFEHDIVVERSYHLCF